MIRRLLIVGENNKNKMIQSILAKSGRYFVAFCENIDKAFEIARNSEFSGGKPFEMIVVNRESDDEGIQPGISRLKREYPSVKIIFLKDITISEFFEKIDFSGKKRRRNPAEMKVLLIEQNPQSRAFLRISLEKIGFSGGNIFDVHSFNTGKFDLLVANCPQGEFERFKNVIRVGNPRAKIVRILEKNSDNHFPGGGVITLFRPFKAEDLKKAII